MVARLYLQEIAEQFIAQGPMLQEYFGIVVNEVKCACLVTSSDLLLNLFAYLIFALFWPVLY